MFDENMVQGRLSVAEFYEILLD